MGSPDQAPDPHVERLRTRLSTLRFSTWTSHCSELLPFFPPRFLPPFFPSSAPPPRAARHILRKPRPPSACPFTTLLPSRRRRCGRYLPSCFAVVDPWRLTSHGIREDTHAQTHELLWTTPFDWIFTVRSISVINSINSDQPSSVSATATPSWPSRSGAHYATAAGWPMYAYGPRRSRRSAFGSWLPRRAEKERQKRTSFCSQVSPDVKAQEVSCWLLRAYEELLEGWDSTRGESYSERYHVR